MARQVKPLYLLHFFQSFPEWSERVRGTAGTRGSDPGRPGHSHQPAPALLGWSGGPQCLETPANPVPTCCRHLIQSTLFITRVESRFLIPLAGSAVCINQQTLTRMVKCLNFGLNSSADYSRLRDLQVFLMTTVTQWQKQFMARENKIRT